MNSEQMKIYNHKIDETYYKNDILSKQLYDMEYSGGSCRLTQLE